MAAHGNRPIIIKRKKIIEGGHHGGAWKVAYADFVTAMMAFFLLMWLLGATTEDQRRGIADFFNPNVAVRRVSGGGDGSFGGDNVMSEDRLAKSGVGASKLNHANNDRAMGSTGIDATLDGEDAGQGDSEALEQVQDALLARSGESMISDGLRQHMLMRVTDEGLVVELFDLPDRSLFDPEGKAEPILKELLRAVGAAFEYSSNQVAIKGFVRAVPVVLAAPRRFETSIERAETVRGLLGQSFDKRRIERVAGFGDRQPAVNDPTAARNNRIELVLLR